MARKSTLGKTAQVNWRLPEKFLEDEFQGYFWQHKSKRNFTDPRDAALYLIKLGLEVEKYRQENKNAEK